MKYRAKCTKIEAMVRSMYSNPITVHDCEDTYIEVCTMKEADLIETINKAMIVAIEKSVELFHYLAKIDKRRTNNEKRI